VSQKDGPYAKVAKINFSREMMAYRSRWAFTADAGRLCLLRGVILSAFAHVDQLASKLSVQASMVPEYAFRPSFPTRTTAKIRYLRKVADTAGPLSQYKALLVTILDRFEGLNDYRTTIAHATGEVFQGGMASFPETKFHNDHSGTVSVHNSTTLDRLERTALQYAKFSRTCESLYYRVCERSILPLVAFQSGWHSNLSPLADPIVVRWGNQGTEGD
jgi:hypothetical protein